MGLFSKADLSKIAFKITAKLYTIEMILILMKIC